MGDTKEIGPPARKRQRVMHHYCSEYVVQYSAIAESSVSDSYTQCIGC